MLTTKEKRQLLQCLHWGSKVLPITVTRGDELEISPNVGLRKARISTMFFAIQLLHVLYVNVRLVQVLMLSQAETPLHHLMLHLTACIAGSVASYLDYLLYIQHKGVHVAVMNLTLQDNSIAHDAGDGKLVHRPGWLDHTLEELIAINLPGMAISGALLAYAVFLYDPQMPLLLYSSMPDGAKTLATVILCYLEELRFLIHIIVVGAPMLQFQLLAFVKIHDGLKAFLRRVTRRKYTWGMAMKDLQTLRCWQIYVIWINTVHRFPIFAFKIVSLGACITSGYAAIAHFKEHILFGIMYYAILTNVGIMYCVLYDRAFSIPRMFQDAARQMLLRMNTGDTVCGQGRVGVLEKKLAGIPKIGIKVGDFRLLERESTPAFVNHVLANVVNMLVTYG